MKYQEELLRMNKIKYLYIDDEDDDSIISLMNGFNDRELIEVDRLEIKRGMEFSELIKLILNNIENKQYKGLLIDLRLDGDGTDRLNYSAISISAELRSIAARKEIISFPIVLCSTDSKIQATYDADKTSQDLFDYTFRKSYSPNYNKVTTKLYSLANGYDDLDNEDYEIQNIFDRDDLNELDSRIFDSIDDNKIVPYDIAHFTINTLFHYSNPLINEAILAARLGIDKNKSKDSWERLKNQLESTKYTGLFSGGWDRWWADKVVTKFKEITGKDLPFLSAKERVELLSMKFKINDLIPASPIKYNVSTEFWTICEAYKMPLDPLEGFIIKTKEILKPWQDQKYISFDAILERIGKSKGIFPHSSEKERIKERKSEKL